MEAERFVRRQAHVQRIMKAEEEEERRASKQATMAVSLPAIMSLHPWSLAL
jgi:hypothetical protein